MEGAASFTQTDWSVVLAAAHSSSTHHVAALERLCRAYWYPLYAYVRRKGYPKEDAKDLTQAFFSRFLLERNYLRNLDSTKGKFRSYLLGALNHYLANEWDRARTKKRGGAQCFISIDLEEAEGRYGAEPADGLSPEKVYDQKWAAMMLQQAYGRLRQQWTAQGKADQFEALKGFLGADGPTEDHETLARSLGTTANNAAVMIHRLRKQYRHLVRTEIAQTLDSSAEIDEEMRYLLSSVSQSGLSWWLR